MGERYWTYWGQRSSASSARSVASRRSSPHIKQCLAAVRRLAKEAAANGLLKQIWKNEQKMNHKSGFLKNWAYNKPQSGTQARFIEGC
jgi:hypothetical protein